MTAPVTPADVRTRAKKLFDRDARTWAAEQLTGVVLDVPLRPPTEREALATSNLVREWVDAWRGVSEDSGIELKWAVRSWSRIGSQTSPFAQCCVVPMSIARGRRARPIGGDFWWRDSTTLSRLTGPDAGRVLRSHARAIADLDAADFDRLVDVLAWLREEPGIGSTDPRTADSRHPH